MESSHDGRLFLILLAGGKGLRAATSAGDPPKQFQETARGPLYLVCLQEFLKLQTAKNNSLVSLTVTVPDSWHEEVRQHLLALENPTAGLALAVPWLLAPAGLTRTGSTWSAVSMLLAGDNPPGPKDLVAVHDAARPFASAGLLDRLASAAHQDKAAVPGLPVPDSLIKVPQSVSDSSHTGEYVDRSTIFSVQTPQVFQWDVFVAAHSWAAQNNQDFTDDGSLLAHRGIMPQVVSGETGNWKITTAADSDRALESLAKPAN